MLEGPRSKGVLWQRLAVAVASASLAGSTLSASAPPAAAAGPNDAAARAYLAGLHGKPQSDYSLVYEREAAVPVSGELVWTGKLVDLATGSVEIVYRDSAGRVGGPDLFAQKAQSALSALPAFEKKASAELRAELARTPDPQARLPVAIWLAADASSAEAAVAARHPEVQWVGGRPVSDDADLLRRIRAELWGARHETFTPVVAELRDRIAAAGGEVAYASTSAPLLFADLPAAAVPGIAELGGVVSMGLEGRWAPAMSSAGRTVEANWTSGPEDAGNGVRVGVVEYHNVRGTGDLSGKVVASWSAGSTRAYTPAGTFDHPTWVAGAIAGQSASFRGVAPGARIVSAGTGGYTPSLTYDRRIIAAADWAISPAGGDVDIVNTSLVQDTATGAEEARRYFDSISYADGRLPVSAAGNYVNFGSWRVGSPGTGYNVLTVGGLDDRNSITRRDDRLWYVPGSNGSNWLDQPSDPWNSHGDYNKPNLVAPAVGVRTANGLQASGTSVATPIVAGVAAQVLANEPALLAWPEGARAVLMAGSVHRVHMPDGSLNVDHEGVGMISARWANRIAVRGGGAWGGYRIDAIDPGETVTQSVSVRRGERLRVALAWDSHAGTGSSGYTDSLTADLDLRVSTPDGVVGSYTLDNSYEFVEVKIKKSGTARLQVLPTRMNAGTERFGLAWAKVGTVSRIAGADRYATAAAISRSTFSAGVPVAYVATGTNFPDALAAGPVAAAAGAPILLASPTSLPSATASELGRLRPAVVILLGGTSALSEVVRDQIDDIVG